MPGVERLSPDLTLAHVRELAKLGVTAVILFGLPEKKDDVGSGAWDDAAAVQETVRVLKNELPDVVVMTDLCLDEYTSHGHWA